MTDQAAICSTASAPSGGCGCEAAARSFEGASAGFRRVLWIVVALNAAMFVIELIAGQLAGSMALQADALDFAGDTATYGITLLVLGRSDRVRANAALFKGFSLVAMALYVLAASAWRTFIVGAPEAITMGVVGAMALAVNVAAALLLLRYREGDANVRSVWLCSRNDALGNLAVLGAAGLTALTQTRWADLGVAVLMASLFLTSAVQIIRQARQELRAA